MPDQSEARASITSLLSLVMIVIGVVMIVRTVSAGGGVLATGVILGALFVAAGAGRLYLRRSAR